jgi:hypothetical protein
MTTSPGSIAPEAGPGLLGAPGPNNLGQLLRDCDELRYLQSPKGAYERLEAAVRADPEAARVKLQNLEGCYRTKMRHREYLHGALAKIQGG